MRSGVKSIIEGINFLEALSAQLNNDVPERQKLEVYGVMCPRWAAAPGTTDADADELRISVVRRRSMQCAPVLYALATLRKLREEHEMSVSIPASELGEQGGD